MRFSDDTPDGLDGGADAARPRVRKSPTARLIGVYMLSSAGSVIALTDTSVLTMAATVNFGRAVSLR